MANCTFTYDPNVCAYFQKSKPPGTNQSGSQYTPVWFTDNRHINKACVGSKEMCRASACKSESKQWQGCIIMISYKLLEDRFCLGWVVCIQHYLQQHLDKHWIQMWVIPFLLWLSDGSITYDSMSCKIVKYATILNFFF